MRKLEDKTLIVASHNEGKIREIRDLIGPMGFEATSAADLNFIEPDETGTTFEENATIKALASAKVSGLPALSDDSGLVVDALNGDPGVYTADWAETPDGRDWNLAMRKVEDALAAKGPDASRGAHFVSVLALAWPDGHVEWFEGRAEGTLVWPPRGRVGFGYDPMFVPHGYDETYAELPHETKNAISHRTEAFELLKAAVF